jgi:hypothetical protein
MKLKILNNAQNNEIFLLVYIKFNYNTVATLLWPSVGVKPNTWKK